MSSSTATTTSVVRGRSLRAARSAGRRVSRSSRSSAPVSVRADTGETRPRGRPPAGRAGAAVNACAREVALAGADQHAAAAVAVAHAHLPLAHAGHGAVAAVGRQPHRSRGWWRRCRGRGCGSGRCRPWPTGGAAGRRLLATARERPRGCAIPQRRQLAAAEHDVGHAVAAGAPGGPGRRRSQNVPVWVRSPSIALVRSTEPRRRVHLASRPGGSSPPRGAPSPSCPGSLTLTWPKPGATTTDEPSSGSEAGSGSSEESLSSLGGLRLDATCTAGTKSESTRRTRWLWPSAISRSPSAVMLSPCGPASSALMPGRRRRRSLRCRSRRSPRRSPSGRTRATRLLAVVGDQEAAADERLDVGGLVELARPGAGAVAGHVEIVPFGATLRTTSLSASAIRKPPSTRRRDVVGRVEPGVGGGPAVAVVAVVAVAGDRRDRCPAARRGGPRGCRCRRSGSRRRAWDRRARRAQLRGGGQAVVAAVVAAASAGHAS